MERCSTVITAGSFLVPDGSFLRLTVTLRGTNFEALVDEIQKHVPLCPTYEQSPAFFKECATIWEEQKLQLDHHAARHYHQTHENKLRNENAELNYFLDYLAANAVEYSPETFGCPIRINNLF
ncbi:unnamed protein product, partial [Mesorhabditis spiculigera]